MVARDLTTGQATEPVPYKKNPNYNSKDGSPEFLPAEPHIGLVDTSADQPGPTYQTGIVKGGTSNPPAGETGEVVRISQNPGDADADAEALGGDFSAFDKETEDEPTVNQKVLNEVIVENAAQPPREAPYGETDGVITAHIGGDDSTTTADAKTTTKTTKK